MYDRLLPAITRKSLTILSLILIPMCGIIGYVGNRSAIPILLSGLRRMEYRGYDSAGVAVVKDGSTEVIKRAGKLVELEKALQESPLEVSLGIGHTRWATQR